MEFQTRPVPGKPNDVELVIVHIPVYHRGRKIAEAVLDNHGNLNMHISDHFDQEGIFRMFMTGEGSSLVIGVDRPTTLKIQKIINRED